MLFYIIMFTQGTVLSSSNNVILADEGNDGGVL